MSEMKMRFYSQSSLIVKYLIKEVNNKLHFNSESIEDLFKMVNWNNVTLDGLLEFILNESKLLLNSGSLQEMLTTEFRKRFKEDYDNSNTFENEGIS